MRIYEVNGYYFEQHGILIERNFFYKKVYAQNGDIAVKIVLGDIMSNTDEFVKLDVVQHEEVLVQEKINASC